jgi:hypothetical protein
VEQFIYLGTTLMNQNFIPEEIKSRLKSGNVCYNSAQNLIFFQFTPKRIKIKIYRTIISPVVLCGCETWSLTLKEELWLKVFQYKLRRIFGPKKDEVKGIWRRLRKEELNDLYPSPNIIWVIETRKLRLMVHIARMGDMRGAYRFLVEKPKERPRRRLDDNIKIDLQEVEWVQHGLD